MMAMGSGAMTGGGGVKICGSTGVVGVLLFSVGNKEGCPFGKHPLPRSILIGLCMNLRGIRPVSL